IEKDADFAKFAGRIQLTYIYEEVLGWDIVKDGIGALKRAHQQAFVAYVDRGIAIKRLSPRLKEYDLARLAAAIDPSADLELDFLGVQTLYDRYLIIDKTGKRSRRLETPQFFWLRVAMGLFLDEKQDREGWALQLYTLYKSRRFCSSTPTLFNSGTLHSQLSSCYLYYVDDSLEGIMYRGIAENAQLSKWAGGLGGSWTAVRGTGAHIAGTNGESQGVIPFLKLHNDQLVAVNQGGKRKGSGCAYLESWHNDIFEFLELRRNTGDDRRRTHDMNTANWIPDLFMKRMEGRQNWTLFRSNETPDLHELYGRKFEERYAHYEKLAEEGKIQGHKVEAIELWKKMLSMLFETGHPWITFKDPCNLRSPQDHVGVIHSSNLCCMTADQRVVTSEGLVTVGELYARARAAASVGSDAHSSLPTAATNTVFGRSGPVAAGPMLLPRPDAPIVRIITKEGYTHKVTPDHKVWVVGRGWVEAQELKRGDHIEIQQAEGLWGATTADDLGLLAGFIAGDGTFMLREGTASVMLDVWAQEFSLIDEIEHAVARVLADHEEQACTTSSLTPRFVGDEYKRRLSSAPLARVLAARGFNRETKLAVPEFVWTGTRETAAAYLRGLYAADATVEGNGEVTTCSLASVSRDFLSQIQILLANFGIKSSLTKMRDASLATLPDGNGGEREYWQAELHRLHVTSIQGCRLLENLTGLGALRQNARYLANLEKPGYAQKMHATFEALERLPNEDAFCLQVFTEEHSWTVNGLITKNTEITLNTSNDETAVCNLGSVILESHLKPDGSLDHEKLRDTIRIALRALDNVIDINFYPTQAAKTSNLRHRPVGLGVMGLANALYMKGVAFASPEAVEFNDEFMEAIAYYAYEASSDLAAERGTYSSYKGSKWDRGLLPQDTLDLLEQERGVPVDVPRGGKMNWEPLRAKIAKQGMRNSNCLAIAPTATISNITNTSPCIEPYYKNLYVKSNLSGEFVVINPFLVEDLKSRGLWNQEMIDALKYFDGDLADIEAVPA
ncbi:MAG: ribonucleoside-diphosphate reductase, partial [Opitutus sp.]|nr:ribonucleoside-diphosphate reductase [Opitutus sp.]